MITISAGRALAYLSRYHHLDSKGRLSGEEDILQYVQRVGCLQYDPLSPVMRNADLMLAARCDGYTPQVLYDLLYGQRRLFDGWDKNMSIIPVEDWPCFTRKREDFRDHYRKRRSEFDRMRREVAAYLRDHPYISSGDIGEDRLVDWAWAPAKLGRAVLESMYHSGELIVHHKEGVRKYYGRSEDLIPPDILNAPDPFSSEQEYHQWYLGRRIASVGLMWDRPSDAWLGMEMNSVQRKAAWQALIEAGNVKEVTVEGHGDGFYIPSWAEHLLLEGDSSPGMDVSLIAPLDCMIWDRNLIEELFGFHYRWEVYTPVAKRQYGYYVLPVLCGDRFIGRLEPVLEKGTGTLLVRSWWPEEGFLPDQETCRALRSAVQRLARSCGASKVRYAADAASLR